MRKRDELTNPNGCMFRARDDEMTFVLLGRDIAAPAAIRAWIGERLRLGKNMPGDPQIVEAEECARTMEVERMAAEPPMAVCSGCNYMGRAYSVVRNRKLTKAVHGCKCNAGLPPADPATV